MSRFAPDWLALREPADTAARASELAERLRAATAAADARRIVDLGAGTGAALRYLAPRLGGHQHWQLVDADPHVLGAARRALADWAHARGADVHASETTLGIDDAGFACRVWFVEADLARGFADVDWPDGTIVSASALLDLVSAAWLERLVETCRAAGSPAWLTLTYDGRIALEPAAAADERVRAAFDRDQRRDKGFGPALGPEAARAAGEAFARAGFSVASAASDWALGTGAETLAGALVEGYAAVALTVEPGEREAFEAWREERAAQLANGSLTLRIGHTDLLALPQTQTRTA